jgi:transcription initiation factor IIE alpha subunit
MRLNSRAMSRDEQSQVGDRCEECGAKLTAAELRDVMESGGPALCSIHAAEDEPGLAAAEIDEP